MDELSGSMPDQKQLLQKLAASPDEKLRDWMRRLGYSDSPVLASMWPCIICCSRVLSHHPRHVDIEVLSQVRSRCGSMK